MMMIIIIIIIIIIIMFMMIMMMMMMMFMMMMFMMMMFMMMMFMMMIYDDSTSRTLFAYRDVTNNTYEILTVTAGITNINRGHRSRVTRYK